MTVVFDPGAPVERVNSPVWCDSHSVLRPSGTGLPIETDDLALACTALLDLVTATTTEIVAVRHTTVGAHTIAFATLRRGAAGQAGEYLGATAIGRTAAEAVVAATVRAFGAGDGLYHLTADWWTNEPGVVRTVAIDRLDERDRLSLLVALAPGEGRLAVDTATTRIRALVGAKQAVVLELDRESGPIDDVERWLDRMESVIDG